MASDQSQSVPVLQVTDDRTQTRTWSNIVTLRALISYRDAHQPQFADASTREEAYADAAQAIHRNTGEKLSGKQVKDKMIKT